MSINNSDLIEKIEVVNVFDGASYIVPIYQRNYAWEKTQIEELIDDINGVDESGSNDYFLGLLVVNKTEDGCYEVIDGQQRLTTLYLMYAYLSNSSIKTLQYKDSLHYEARRRYKEALANPAVSTKDAEEINRGFSCIKTCFDSKKINLSNFYKKLIKVLLIRVQVPEHIDLNHYFEVMNTRGEQLELHQIAKGRILSVLKNSEDEALAAKIWDSCSNMDSYVQMNFDVDTRNNLFTDDWEELDGIRDWDDLKNAVLPKLDNKNNKVESSDSASALNSLSNESDASNENDDPDESDEDDKSENTLVDILRDCNQGKYDLTKEEEATKEKETYSSAITFSHFLLQVNAIEDRTAKEKSQPRVSDKAYLESSWIDEDEFSLLNPLNDKDFIKKLEKNWGGGEIKESEEIVGKRARDFIVKLLRCRVLFDKYIIKRKRKEDTEDWSLSKLHRNSKKKNATPTYPNTYGTVGKDGAEIEDKDIRAYARRLLTLQEALRITITSPRAMHWITVVLDHLFNEGSPKNLISVLENYCRRKIKKEQEAENFGCQGTGTAHIIFSYLDYLLFYETQEFKDAHGFGNIKEWGYSFKNQTVEHFFPQHPDKNEEWDLKDDGSERFKRLQEAAEKWKEDIEQWQKNDGNGRIVDRFGNLALIDIGSNSSLSNRPPIVKVDEKRIIAQSIKLRIMANLTENNKGRWTKDLAEAHGKEMLDILQKDIDKLKEEDALQAVQDDQKPD